MVALLGTVWNKMTKDFCGIVQSLSEHLSNVFLNYDCIIQFINQILFDADESFVSIFSGETEVKQLFTSTWRPFSLSIGESSYSLI
ncbi:hypothetical protein EON65_04790 [archaeon]|nr:MAG: hypothetical protein EON65_04790 [archaeon]